MNGADSEKDPHLGREVLVEPYHRWLSLREDLAAAARPPRVLFHHKHTNSVPETKHPSERNSVLSLSITAANFNGWAERGKAPSSALAGGLSAGCRQVCVSCCNDASRCNGSEENLTKILEMNCSSAGVCCNPCAASIPGASCRMKAQICEAAPWWMESVWITDMLHGLTWRWMAFIRSSRIETKVIP